VQAFQARIQDDYDAAAPDFTSLVNLNLEARVIEKAGVAFFGYWEALVDELLERSFEVEMAFAHWCEVKLNSNVD
jgi:hypothetical protein